MTSSHQSSSSPLFALVGNPNCGKTTLFNQLTGLRQKIGNYPGVTVEKVTGSCFSQHGEPIQLIDLPGAYQLEAPSPDQAILKQALLGQLPGTPIPDRILYVADASNLDEQLYLLTQILELGIPTLLILNMADLAERRGVLIDTGKLEKALGIPVITTQANKKETLPALRVAMSRKHLLPPPALTHHYPKLLQEALLHLQSFLQSNTPGQFTNHHSQALKFLENPNQTIQQFPQLAPPLRHWQAKFQQENFNWLHELTYARKTFISKLTTHCVVTLDPNKKTLTEHLDSILLHPAYGWCFLLLTLTTLFTSIFYIAKFPMGWIESGFASLQNTVTAHLPNGPLQSLLTDGALAGVGSVLVFLPQIFLLFLFINFLESSGYLPRAVIILDRVMNKVGLPGKAFIPLLSSFACAIPGIMATRTIASRKERLATIMIAPWMSCSARIPVFLLIVATLIPNNNHWSDPLLKASILTLAYALGIAGAFSMAWTLRKTLLQGTTPPPPATTPKLPAYQRPPLRVNILDATKRSSTFVKRAGTIIFAFSIILWFLINYPQDLSSSTPTPPPLDQSWLGTLGKSIEPILSPLGFDWRIGIGLLVSFTARELFVSTLTIITNVQTSIDSSTPLISALHSLTWPDGSPLFTPLTCLSLLVFFVYAMQCISTVAIVRQETKTWSWPIFQLVYMTAFAYLASLLTYQLGSLFIH